MKININDRHGVAHWTD